MIRHNELILGGRGTSSFPFKVIVENRVSLQVARSKTQLLEHSGLSGAIVQGNKHRELIEKNYRLLLRFLSSSTFLLLFIAVINFFSKKTARRATNILFSCG